MIAPHLLPPSHASVCGEIPHRLQLLLESDQTPLPPSTAASEVGEEALGSTE